MSNKEIMCQILKVILVAVVVNSAFAKVIPDFITVCPKWTNECLKTNMQAAIPRFVKGIPELNVISTDPLRDDDVKLELPGNFKIQLNNGSLTGLRKCIVEKVDYKNDEVDLSLRCNVTINGQYKARGQILIVSINGDGDAKIKTTDLIINAKIKFADKVRDGKTYYEIKDAKFSQKFGGRVHFSLTNLFKGNEQLSETVLQFLNENWKEISEEFGGPIFDRLVTMIFGTVKEFFHNVPKDELLA